MDLALRASFPLDDTAAQLGYYPLTIAAVTPKGTNSKQAENGSVVVLFTFLELIPNSGGLMSTPTGAFARSAVPDRIAGEGTKELRATWRSGYLPRDPSVLKGTPLRFLSTDYPPWVKSPAQQNTDLLQKVINSVDRLGAGS